MGGCHTPQGRSPRGNAGQPWSHRVVVATPRAKGVKRNDEVVGQTFFLKNGFRTGSHSIFRGVTPFGLMQGRDGMRGGQPLSADRGRWCEGANSTV